VVIRPDVGGDRHDEPRVALVLRLGPLHHGLHPAGLGRLGGIEGAPGGQPQAGARLRLGRLGLAELEDGVPLVEPRDHRAGADGGAPLDRDRDDAAVDLGGHVGPGVGDQRAGHLEGRRHRALLDRRRGHRDRCRRWFEPRPGGLRVAAADQEGQRQGGQDAQEGPQEAMRGCGLGHGDGSLPAGRPGT